MSDTTKRISNLLPEVLQTDVLKKFFAATADNLFQPENVEYLNGYIGQKPSWYSTNDIYIKENDKNRQKYQVESTAVSRNSESNNISHTLFYEDLLNNLRFQGGLVNDQNRLFEQEYYSFGLPIDVDKWINPQSYVWLPTGPDAITLLDTTSIADIQKEATYTYTGRYTLANNATNVLTGSLSFTSGLKVVFADDIDVGVRGDQYIIENVGRKILLVKDEYQSNLAWENPIEFDSSVWDQNSLNETPVYICIGRGSENQNPWSLKNRWFHVDVVALTQTNIQNINSNLAKRPIVEFDRNIKLYDFATASRGYINVIDSKTLDINTVIGKSNYVVDGVTLDDNMVVLFTNLINPLENNKLYQVSNLRNNGSIILVPVANNSDITGAPIAGDGVTVLQGSWYNQNIDLPNYYINWYYTGTMWKQGQTWNPKNMGQAPLFELYDVDGNNLADPSIYPLSSFAGSTLFEYQTDTTGTIDPYLGFIPVTDSNQPNEYLFENTLVSKTWYYQPTTTQQQITGYAFWRTQDQNGNDFYANNWYRAPVLSRQYIVNEYVSAVGQKTFVTDQSPATGIAGPATITVEVGSTQLIPNQDFVVANNIVTLNNGVIANQLVKIRTWNNTTTPTTNGYFEIPRNLEANPNTLDITTTNRSQLLDHIKSIIINQSGLTGNIIGANNYRDTAQNQGLGTKIVQHRAPMLKLMVLNAVNQSNVVTSSVAQLSPMNAMQWAQREYLRFYNKFINTLFNLYNQRSYTAEKSPDDWVAAALKTINIGKTVASPWANSGFDGPQGNYCSFQSTNPTYVPTSATRLGVTPAYQPTVFFDNSQPTSPLSMRCHNGAIVVLKDFDNNNLGTIEGSTSTTNPLALDHPIARAWLQFETNLFTNLPTYYSNVDYVPLVDARTIFSGKWRSTNYSSSEKTALFSPAFERWSTTNQIDAFKNTTYDLTDQFTWNYSSCLDKDNAPLPGNWRGIYFYYYDTDTPHLTPWMMVGFTQKPTWWDSEYGSAPYTSGNTKMWLDLANGYIPQGARTGVWENWARPDLLKYIPVDEFGDLLSPVLCGIIQTPPNATEAASDWKFGDRGPIENVWLTTVDTDLVVAQVTYLAKPAQFIEYMWDSTRTQQVFATQSNSQWIYTDTNTRKSNSQFFVHRENPQGVTNINSSAAYFGSCGVQQWISEFLVNDNLNLTTYFGNVIRGADANLGYRLGGFTDGSSIRMLVESFGLSANDNLLLPQDDITTILNRSGSIKEIFYSGVIVERMGNSNGWRVIGYDSVNPFFTIVPSDQKGLKSTVVVDNARVVEYQTGLKTVVNVPYATVFASRQDVYDFLIGLGRYQSSQGWNFDQYSESASRVQDWSLSAREFLFWSQGPWAAGTFITLSPLAQQATFKSSFGMVQYVGTVVNGSYSLLDKSGRVIKTSDVDFLRLDDTITVKSTGTQGIYGLRLFVTTIEHALVFNNSTIFGDIVFDPLLDIRQNRFKILAFRSLNWNGRIEAPGYMVVQSQQTIGDILQVNNKIISNFEKSVSDIRRMYNIDVPTTYMSNGITQTSSQTQTSTANISALSKHLIAYQSRDYLTNLLVDDATQFQFYQGMIQQKGTAASINKLLRNTNILKPTDSFQYYEEFAFRTAMYGANDVIHGTDVVIIQEQVTSNPQLINLFGAESYDSLADDTITIVPNDNRILNKTPITPPWTTRTTYGQQPEDLPTAGYVLYSEVDYYITDDTALLSLWTNQNALNPLTEHNTIWKFIDITRGWDIYRLTVPNWVITNTTPDLGGRTLTTITTNTPHNLSYGTNVIISDVITTSGNINGTFSIINVTKYTFDISLLTQATGSGGSTLVYTSIRFDTYADLLANTPASGWSQGDLVYVDGTSQTPWNVYEYESSYWVPVRTEELKIDTSKILNSRLYDRTNLQTLSTLILYDPIKGIIPGIVKKELFYITAYDPAKYNTGDSSLYEIDANNAWGPNQVGQTWWDLSTTRYIDYEIGANSYRKQFWGQIASGTTVDVYEWIRSVVPPASWAGAVASGNQSATGGTVVPSGYTKGTNYPYVTRSERNSDGSYSPAYYYWVANSITIPSVDFRNISTAVITNILTQPQNFDIAWWSPINSTTALLGNIGQYLKHDQTVWQMNYVSTDSATNIYKQWTLLRPNDPQSYPTDMLWNRMRSSLVEFDQMGNTVPNLRLPELTKNGIEIRPAQTWFNNPTNARRAFVKSVNYILANSAIAPTIDPERIEWTSYFTNSEPIPQQNNQLAPVVYATTASLNAIYYNEENGLGASLFSINNEILTIDSNIPSVGDRVLIKDQTSSGLIATNAVAQNGLYEVVNVGSSSTQWHLIRTLDFCDSSSDLKLAQVTVTHGQSNGNTTWYQTNANILKIGQDPITWKKGKAQFVWNYQVNNLAERNQLQNQLVPRSIVLVNASSTTNNRWTMWQWQAYESDKKTVIPGWTLVRTQSWVTKNCWQYVDWYASGYDNTTVISYEFATLADRNLFQSFNNGDIIKVDNTGNGNWNLYIYDTTNPILFTVIGVQNGGVQLSDNLWDYATYGLGYDGGNFGVDYQGFEYDTRIELDYIIQGLRPSSNQQVGLLKSDSTTNEWNQIFFDMINYVFSEQTFVDWAFKTSFVTLKGFAQELIASPYYLTDNIDSLTAYINETKPFRVNIRQFIDFRTATEYWNSASTDFDKPPYVDAQNQTKILELGNQNDVKILSTSNAYASWFNNYSLSNNTIRSIKTQLVFDRVSCNSDGAASRITQSYAPTGDMIPVDSPLLISGCAPKGTTLDGSAFTTTGEWGEPIWDNPEGWDQTEQTFDQYYDIGISGGPSPKYWLFQGDGVTKSFELPWAPQSPSNLTVLVNTIGKNCPTDWSIKNFVTQVIIAEAGVGYKVNDELIINTGTALQFATFVVTNVTNTGAITEITLQLQGSYSYVPTMITIPVSGGSGVNATVAVRWGGTSLEFVTAPSTSTTGNPNIWISEQGGSFVPAMSAVFDTVYDGATMNSAHTDGNHPEELMKLWNRDSLIVNTHVQPSGGFGNVLTQSFATDGKIDQFIIGQPIVAVNQLIVSNNGVLKKQGATDDYVVNIILNKVVFVNPPAAGNVTIVSVGFGGASFGLGDYSITNRGIDYDIGDIVTFTGGTTASVSAIQATEIQLESGGEGYSIGDLLLLKNGVGSQTVTAKVTSVTSVGSVGGIITGVELVNSGYYTEPASVPYGWFTNGVGSGITMSVRWGVIEINVLTRGLYTTQTNSISQTSVTNSSGGSAIGNSLTLLIGDTYIQEEHTIICDGVTYQFPLSTIVNKDSILVTINGVPTQSWGLVYFAQDNTLKVSIGFVPEKGDVIIIVVYNSTLYSLQQTQEFYIFSPLLTYDLAYPPSKTVNSLIYANGVKLRPLADYSITTNQITFVDGSVNDGYKITVITFPEDSTASFVSDQFTGSENKLYEFSQLPADFSGVQVFVDGKELSQIEDYEIKKIGANYYVSIPENYNTTNNIEVYYPTLKDAKPAVAWKSFTNLFGDTQYIRMDDTKTTLLTDDLNWNDLQINVADGTMLAVPTQKTPGVIWINSERIEYYEITPNISPSYPNAVSLSKLNRGSLGTPNGVPDQYLIEFWDGTGQTSLFLISIVGQDSPTIEISVDDVLLVKNVDYQIVNNPFGVIGGLYVQFISMIPQAGNNNIKMTVFQSDWTTTSVSYRSGTKVKDGSARQKIPGGYVWPSGNEGIQYNNSYQTKFLLNGK
jgi:hypothetical protein